VAPGPELPTVVTPDNLRLAAQRAGNLTGWDFSSVRDWRATTPWDYEHVVAAYAETRMQALDVGTGGGEVIARLGKVLGRVVAVDHKLPMAMTAQARLSGSADVVVADGRALPFVDATFDIVLDRHAPVFMPEFARVLRPGGLFITQQVGGRNMQSIFDAFGWGSNAKQWGQAQTFGAIKSAARASGLKTLRAEEYEVEYALADIESLVFILTYVPFPEPFDPVCHVAGVNRLLAESADEQGIKTTEHRVLLVARKE
jgi:ubiquinone/menaquinone biosynthesis C-methylase UbiE